MWLQNETSSKVKKMKVQEPRLSESERMRQLEISAAIDRYLDKRYPQHSDGYRQVLKSSIVDNVAILESAIEKSAINLERASGSTPARLRALRRCLKGQKTSKGQLQKWLCGHFSERERRAAAEIAALPGADELQRELYNVIGDYSAYVWSAVALLTFAGIQLWRRANGISTDEGTPSEYRQAIKESNARIKAITDKAREDQAKEREDLIAAQEAAQKAKEEAAAKYGEKEAIRRQAVEDARIQAALERDRRIREHKDRHAISFWANPLKGVSELTYAARQLPAPILLALMVGVGVNTIGNPQANSKAREAVKTLTETQRIVAEDLRDFVARPVRTMPRTFEDVTGALAQEGLDFLKSI